MNCVPDLFKFEQCDSVQYVNRKQSNMNVEYMYTEVLLYNENN